MFCCVAGLLVFWFADRVRSLDFEPISVTPCVADCLPYVGPEEGSPMSVFSDALEPRGVTSFSRMNICAQLADTLQERGEGEAGVDQILARISSRGTVAITRPEDGTLVINPGPRNNGFNDALRDAFSFGTARGCHPINYKPVFWPLFVGWVLLAGLRVFRGRQEAWAKR